MPATAEGAGRGAAVATAGTALSRVTGFVRLAAMAYALGIAETRLADTYNLANTTPNIVYELVLGGILSAVLMRVYIEVRHRSGDEDAMRFVTRVTNLSALALAVMVLAGILLAPWIMKIYTLRTPGAARAAQQELGTMLLRLFIPQILFYGFSTISTAVLNAHRRFGVPMFAPVLNNLIVAASFAGFAAVVPAALRDVATTPLTGRLILGVGTTAGVAVMALVPWLSMRSIGIRRVRGAGFWDSDLRRLAKLSVYTVGYVVTNQLGLWVTLILATRIQGGVTAYQTAFVFFQLPHGLLTVSIATALGPGMAEAAVARRDDAFRSQVGQGMRLVVFLMLPAVAGYLALAPRIVAVMLEHGIVTGRSTALIAGVLRAFALGLLFFSTFYLLLRAFQAFGDTRTPALINVGGFAVNMAVNFALFLTLPTPAMKIAGLAAGHAASYAFNSAAAAILLRRKIKHLEGTLLARTTVRCAAASVATGVVAWAAAEAAAGVFDVSSLPGEAAQIAVATAAGLLVYGALTKALKVEEFEWLRTQMFRRHSRSPGGPVPGR